MNKYVNKKYAYSSVYWEVKYSDKVVTVLTADFDRPSTFKQGEFSVKTECVDHATFAFCDTFLYIKEDAIKSHNNENFDVKVVFSGKQWCEIRNIKIKGSLCFINKIYQNYHIFYMYCAKQTFSEVYRSIL